MSGNIKFDVLGYYSLFNLPQNAGDEEIRAKYKELVKKWHPDYNKSPEAIEIFQKISVAYNVIKDDESRLAYILLSMIYNKNNIPDKNSLAIIKNVHQQEDLNMRAFRLIEITGKGITHRSIDKVYYCSQYEAVSVITNIAKYNWLYGFWGISAFFANIRAIAKNLSSVNDRKENLKLFIHNALAYLNENKNEEALTLFMLAKEYANKNEGVYIDKYISLLKNNKPLLLKKWNFTKLQRLQLIYPLGIIIAIALGIGFMCLSKFEKTRQDTTGVKQTVVFSNGQSIYSDVSVSKIFDIPVNLGDKNRLYHLTEDADIRHGADNSFDIYKRVKKGTTVRLTGYTVDEKWLRVMLDNGEMGFVERHKTKKGIGNEIPLWSKIYKEN